MASFDFVLFLSNHNPAAQSQSQSQSPSMSATAIARAVALSVYDRLRTYMLDIAAIDRTVHSIIDDAIHIHAEMSNINQQMMHAT